MRRDQVGELFYITHVGNVGGILTSGILSHNRAARVPHVSVSLNVVQEIRSHIQISETRMLHDHANLYICGRNAMMYFVINNNPITNVCLLRVSPDVLDLPDVVVSDGNAARSGATRFDPPPTGIAGLDFDRVHAEFWTHGGDEALTYEHKRVKQAEVLVPDWIGPQFILGAYAPTPNAASAVETASRGRVPVLVARYPFFRGRDGS